MLISSRNQFYTGFQTLTGIKFVVTATPGTIELDLLLQAVYELYADYVLKASFDLSIWLTYFFSVIPKSPRGSRLTGALYTFNSFITLLQNPFYEMDMPIRCELFNRHLDKLVQRMSAVQSKKKGI
jgi:hypothetical protein